MKKGKITETILMILMIKYFFMSYGIYIPNFISVEFKGLLIYVDFKQTKFWKEFTEWVDKGNLIQCEVEGKKINVWVGKCLGEICTDNPRSLQGQFDNYCEMKTLYPDGYGFASFIIDKPKD